MTEADHFIVLDRNRQKHQFPQFIPCFSMARLEEALAETSHWETVHKLAKDLHKQVFPVRQYLAGYEALKKQSQQQIHPEEFLRGFLDDAYWVVQAFSELGKFVSTGLIALPEAVRESTPVKVLTKLPVCIDAILRNLSSEDEVEIRAAINMFGAIEQWLMHTIYISDMVLEQSRNGNQP